MVWPLSAPAGALRKGTMLTNPASPSISDQRRSSTKCRCGLEVPAYGVLPTGEHRHPCLQAGAAGGHSEEDSEAVLGKTMVQVAQGRFQMGRRIARVRH